jgi:thymidylate synthase (FAD)
MLRDETNEEKIHVLDHGYVILRNIAGPTRRNVSDADAPASDDYLNTDPPRVRKFDADDTDVANAARLSFEGQDQDRQYADEMKLTRYLMKNHHDTPFEVIEVWMEFKLPIFVARQLVRQRTQTLNEASARYITLPADWYIPEVVGGKPVNKKQGQADNLDQETQQWFKDTLELDCHGSYQAYLGAMDRGVAPEHARMFLHLNHYTHWLAKMNLRNLMMSLLRLRWHSHAQIESQQYAHAVFLLLDKHIPGIMGIYTEFYRESAA